MVNSLNRFRYLEELDWKPGLTKIIVFKYKSLKPLFIKNGDLQKILL